MWQFGKEKKEYMNEIHNCFVCTVTLWCGCQSAKACNDAVSEWLGEKCYVSEVGVLNLTD